MEAKITEPIVVAIMIPQQAIRVFNEISIQATKT